MPDFNQYNFKRAGKNFFQVFIIGYLAFVLLIFTWSATSDYGFEKTLNDFSLELIIDPIFWLFPFLMGILIGVPRGVQYPEIDFNDPNSLEAYLENERWENQPSWLKITLTALVLLLLYLLFSPESEVSVEMIEHMREMAVKINNPALYQELDETLADGMVMQSEFKNFLNASLNAEFENFKTANETN